MSLEGKVQQCRLLTLPPEIFLLVSEEAHPIERIVLALTCKDALARSMRLQLETPDPLHHRTPWCTRTSVDTPWLLQDLDSLGPPCPCGGLELLQYRLRPRTAKGNIARSRILCLSCLRYLPWRVSYWRHWGRRQPGYTRDCDIEDYIKDWDWGGWQPNMVDGVNPTCPECRVKERE